MNVRTWMLVLAVVVGFAGLAWDATGVAAADDTASAVVVDKAGPGHRGGAGPGAGQAPGAGKGIGRSAGASERSLVAVAASVLGMERQELVAELRDGKTIADVAADKGVAVDDIVKAFVEAKAKWLQEMVDAGRLTQEQADEMLARAADEAARRVSEAHTPTPRGRHGGGAGARQGSCLP